MPKVFIDGFYFPEEVFHQNIEVFKEGLAHSSLSIEMIFKEVYELEEQIKLKCLKNSRETYQSLEKKEQEKITNQLRYFVIYSAMYRGIIPRGITEKDQDKINKIYEEMFSYFDNYIYNYIVFENKEYDMKATYRKVIELFQLLPNYKLALEQARKIKEDHLKAFDYALSLEHIGPKEIITINTMVNEGSENKEIGYKKVNNIIEGSSFATMTKEAIPTEVAKLVYEYDNNFGQNIGNYQDNSLTHEERRKLSLEIFEKEARFHILLERLHPFSDGNGRCGRIILNCNLIKQGLAPVLITEVSREKYISFINNQDYKGMALWLMECSNQTLTLWIAELRNKMKVANIDIEPDEIKSSL